MSSNNYLQKALQTKALPSPAACFSAALMCVLLLTVLSTNVPTASALTESDDKVPEYPDINELKMTMLTDIASIVFSDDDLATDVKSDIVKLAVTPLRKSAVIEIAGTDRKTRPVAVSFQKAFEQSVLKMIDDKQVSQVTAIIHTRKPTTPLCNPRGEALPQTMHPDMKCDPKRCKTIQDRTVTLREMAKKESLNLYVAYPEGGLLKRSPEEQRIYHQELSNAVNTSLHDTPLSCADMPDEIVGASYILKTNQGNELYFANNGKQAIDASGETLWRYWFGNLKDAPLNERYREVVNYLKGCGMSGF